MTFPTQSGGYLPIATTHDEPSQQQPNDLATAIDLLAQLRTRFDRLGGPSSLVHGTSMQAQINLMRDVDAFLAVHRAASAR